MIETLKYRSGEPTPTLPDSLYAAKIDIQLAYKTRVEKRQGMTVAEAWNGVCDWLGKEQNNATRLARFVDNPLVTPDAGNAVALATAFWVEAAIANDLGDFDRSWCALLRAHYYLGMASGPETADERSASGGVGRGETYAPLREMLLAWLNDRSPDSFISAKEARCAVLPQLKALRDSLGQGRSTNPDKLMEDWMRSDPEIRAAFERVVRGGLKRGRKKKSAGD